MNYTHRTYTVIIPMITHRYKQSQQIDFCLLQEQQQRASNDIAITVHACDQRWTFHCDKDQPLANALFIPLENLVGKKCIH